MFGVFMEIKYIFQKIEPQWQTLWQWARWSTPALIYRYQQQIYIFYLSCSYDFCCWHWRYGFLGQLYSHLIDEDQHLRYFHNHMKQNIKVIRSGMWCSVFRVGRPININITMVGSKGEDKPNLVCYLGYIGGGDYNSGEKVRSELK
jgi:hypothetical protein